MDRVNQGGIGWWGGGSARRAHPLRVAERALLIQPEFRSLDQHFSFKFVKDKSNNGSQLHDSIAQPHDSIAATTAIRWMADGVCHLGLLAARPHLWLHLRPSRRCGHRAVTLDG